jgi:hypothetical protein
MASREEIQERIHIEQAWVDGKDVQIKNDYTWLPIGKDDALFLFDKCQYRIKPEPKDFWVNEYKENYSNCGAETFYGDTNLSEIQAKEKANGSSMYIRTIHLREVTDE